MRPVATTVGDGPGKWVGRRVVDIANKGQGELTAVVHETVTDHQGRATIVHLAYVRPDRGAVWSTAVANIVPVPSADGPS